MTDSSASTTGSATSGDGSLVIPDDLKKQFPELIALIVASESMNDEEREYWLNILPIMSPEQIANLQGILENERDQLAAIDAKYDTSIDPVKEKQSVEETGKKIADKKAKREQQEAAAEADEGASEAEILSQIDSL